MAGGRSPLLDLRHRICGEAVHLGGDPHPSAHPAKLRPPHPPMVRIASTSPGVPPHEAFEEAKRRMNTKELWSLRGKSLPLSKAVAK